MDLIKTIARINAAARLASPACTGVSVGSLGDRATWLPDYTADATQEDRAAVSAALAALDLSAPTADDVRAEASRRMQVFVGARDAAHLEIVIANASREAIRLLRARSERSWTPAEAARAAQLEAADAAIEAIRAASNAMETEPPADYAADARWPNFGGA